MSAKHFINDPAHLVATSLRGLTITNPSVALDVEHKIVYRRTLPHAVPQVSIVSGGGSGHEPSFSGMVGEGMLTAAVAGTIFASPSAEQIRTAIASRVDTSQGVLVIVMNYTRDVLKFGMAVERARAAGIAVEMVIVDDDVGVGRVKAGKVGRRGIAGTVVALKAAGALAAAGRPLDEVARAARLVSTNLASVGASLSHVHVPGRRIAEDSTLPLGYVEVGMGIHNEPGPERISIELPALISKMLGQLLDLNDKDPLSRALEDVIAAEPDITEYDTVVGDGDCGICLRRGAEAVLRHVQAGGLSGDAVVDIASIVPIIESTVDGTSGALYSIFLHALVTALRSLSPDTASPQVWASALKKSSRILSEYTPARPGDRTLIDALHPFVEVLDSTGNVKQAADAALEQL
ncbi:Dihydroxyacetone kinase 1 like protein [Verticillium longisporum]|nr:Dihydroxyacetone kinase 1 like protein [Verticillium longisporum]